MFFALSLITYALDTHAFQKSLPMKCGDNSNMQHLSILEHFLYLTLINMLVKD